MRARSVNNRSITLMELLVALTLLGLIILYYDSMQRIGTDDAIVSDRRAKTQNDASFVLEHITKHLRNAIGNATQYDSGQTINPVVILSVGAGNRYILKYWVDNNGNAQWEPDTAKDEVDSYLFRQGNNSVTYMTACNNFKNANCPSPATSEVISTNIIDVTFTPAGITYQPFSLTGNNIGIKVTSCYDPSGGAGACGSKYNPQVTMQMSVAMPGISIN